MDIFAFQTEQSRKGKGRRPWLLHSPSAPLGTQQEAQSALSGSNALGRQKSNMSHGDAQGQCMKLKGTGKGYLEANQRT